MVDVSLITISAASVKLLLRGRPFAGLPRLTSRLGQLAPPPVDGIDGKMTGAMLFGWEGSRRSGVALTMRHGLCCLSAVSVA